jgi:hypothetical protein
MRIVETLILNSLPVAVVLPCVAIEVDLPLDLEEVIPLEIPTVLRLGFGETSFWGS